MAVCGYSAFVGGPCGSSTSTSANATCVRIDRCTEDAKSHLKLFDCFDSYRIFQELRRKYDKEAPKAQMSAILKPLTKKLRTHVLVCKSSRNAVLVHPITYAGYVQSV